MRADPEKAAVDFARALILDNRDLDIVKTRIAGRDLDIVNRIAGDDALFVRVMAELSRSAPVADTRAAEILLRLGRAKRLAGLKDVHVIATEYRIALDRGWMPDLTFENAARAFIWVEDLASYRIFCTRLLSSYEHLPHPSWGDNNTLAWCYVLGPGALADMSTPVRLAEAALGSLEIEGSKDQTESLKFLSAVEADDLKKRWETGRKEGQAAVLNTLGAALFRAGRFEEAIRRLEDGIRLRKGGSIPEDWPFLAMAHYRLGHIAEAKRWLARFRDHRQSAGAENQWYDSQVLLRREAEALILYDPVFPADPFAH
jgi:hypothetical protein